VVDGDTLKVRIDLGFDVWRVEKIQIIGVRPLPLTLTSPQDTWMRPLRLVRPEHLQARESRPDAVLGSVQGYIRS
jgi:hypothetical protein